MFVKTPVRSVFKGFEYAATAQPPDALTREISEQSWPSPKIAPTRFLRRRRHTLQATSRFRTQASRRAPLPHQRSDVSIRRLLKRRVRNTREHHHERHIQISHRKRRPT